MPVNGAVVMKDATGITVTAGTAQTYTNDGAQIPNGVHVVDMGNTDFRTRRSLTLTVRQPTYDAKIGYSKDKKVITLTCPKILISGVTVFNILRIQREIHPESSVAEAADINRIGAQLVSDADFDAFWSAGSLL